MLFEIRTTFYSLWAILKHFENWSSRDVAEDNWLDRVRVKWTVMLASDNGNSNNVRRIQQLYRRKVYNSTIWNRSCFTSRTMYMILIGLVSKAADSDRKPSIGHPVACLGLYFVHIICPKVHSRLTGVKQFNPTSECKLLRRSLCLFEIHYITSSCLYGCYSKL